MPYAPYLMFMIKRVTSYKFDKDGLHTIYKIEKTQASGASRAVRRSPSIEDVPESSRSRPRKDMPESPPMQRGPHMRTDWKTVKPTKRLESV